MFLCRLLQGLIISTFAILFAPLAALGQFSEGTLLVSVIGDGITPLDNSAHRISLIELFHNGIATGRSVTLPDDSPNALTDSGSAKSSGHLQSSPDGSQLFMTGFRAAIGTQKINSSASQDIPRALIGIRRDGSLTTHFEITDRFSGEGIRSVTSQPATGLLIAAPSGLVRADTTSSPITYQPISIPGEPRFVTSCTDSAGNRATFVSTATDIHHLSTGFVVNSLPKSLALGLQDAHAFIFLDRDPLVGAEGLGGLDTLYVADGSSGSDFGQALIRKFEWRGDRWTVAGVATLAVDGTKLFGITANRAASGAITLHATTSIGPNNALVTIDDRSNGNRFGGDLSGTLTVLARAGSQQAFRGITSLPQDRGLPDLTLAVKPSLPTLVKTPFPLQIDVKNIGSAVAKPSQLRIKLPPDLRALADTSAGSIFTEGIDSLATEIPSLEPGQSIRIDLLVEAVSEGTIVVPKGAIKVDSSDTSIESVETNNENTEFTIISGRPSIELTARQGRVFQRGDADAQMFLRVRNAGTVPTASPLRITPSLPPGVRILGFSGAGWSATMNELAAPVSATRSAPIPAGSECDELLITLAIDPSAGNGNATFTFTLDDNPDRDGSSDLLLPLKIQDAKSGLVSFETDSSAFAESLTSGIVKVIRQGGRLGPLTATVTALPGTAVPNRDFRLTTSSISFPDGSDEAFLPFEILKNTSAKTHRSFSIQLGPSTVSGQFATTRVTLLKPDSVPPSVKISAPISGSIVKGPTVEIAGKVSDNFGGLSLSWSLNGGSVTPNIALPADGSFRIPMPTRAGLNTVSLFATDAAGNVNQLQHAFFQEGATSVSIASIPANGGTVTLSPKVDPSKVQVDTAITLSATPSAGFLWSGWELSSRPGELVRTPRVNLKASTGLSVRAHFSISAYAEAAGTFSGLVRPAVTRLPRHENSGSSTLAMTGSGAFSGKIRLGDEETSISGSFDESGIARFGDAAQVVLPWYRKDGRTLHLRVNIDPINPFEVNGSISDPAHPDAAATSEFRLTRISNLAVNPHPGSYNVAAPSQSQDNGIAKAFFHEGAAIGTVVVPSKGPASFAIRLPDGNAVSGSAPLREDGSFVLQSWLYNNSGQLSGDIFISPSSSDPGISGNGLLWLMPPGTNPAFPMGWPEGVRMDLKGSLYPSSAPALRTLLPDLGDSAPNARLAFTAPSSNDDVRVDVQISSDGKIASKLPSPAITAAINLKTGSIQGTLSSGKSHATSFYGILLPKKKGSTAYGHFLLPNGSSGNISLSEINGNQGRIVISEVASRNVNGPYDEDGDASDWIELHNPNPFEIDLEGWTLSDDPSDPKRWEFPKAKIDPRGFLLVWASGKDRRQSATKLHTNFSLKSEGEFLSLSRPDGRSEQSFPLGIPKLLPGESYGADFGSKRFIEANAAVRYFTGPGPLPSGWASIDFNDVSWTSGKQPLGYGIGTKGLSVRQVLTNYEKGGVPTLAAAEALLKLPKGHADLVAERTFIVPQLNLLGDGGDGHYDGNLPVPISGEPYVIHATGTLLIPEAGIYTFGLNSDDGGTIRIDGTAVMVDDSNHGPEDHLSQSVTLSAGPHSIEVIMWEQGGGDEVELFAARGTHTSWNEDFRLVGASDGLRVITYGAPGDGNSALGTDLESSVKATRTDFGVRYPFICEDPAKIESLTLQLAANDGFIIYLNGTEVLRENAGAPGSAVGRASAARDPVNALVPRTVDLSNFKQSLRKGKNILAARCLSAEMGDSSMLLAASLSGHSAVGTTYGIFSPSDAGLTSTPNAINSGTFTIGALGEVRGNRTRGIHNTPFELTLIPPSPGATIRYTLDGSIPSPSNGENYTKPIPIAKTTILRFVAIQTGMKPGPISTSTFLFPNDIIRQSADNSAPGKGWPQDSVNGQAIDYGMDQRVVDSTDPEVGGVPNVKAALEAIPSLSIVTELGNLFDPVRGIWVNPYNRGLAWERPASVEFINDQTHPAGGFQTDCGIRIRGGFSRSTDNPKHALKLYFRESYSGELKYPLFGPTGSSTFEQIDIRTAQNYSWSFGGDPNNTFLREEMSRELQGAMGQPYARGRDFHLFLNGQYWGLYNFDERTEASFGASYLGGKKSEYDAVKCEQDAGYTTGVNNGNITAWSDFFELTKSFRASPTNEAYFAMQGLAPDGMTPSGTAAYLDVDNLIDYMLLTFWSGNLDGCTSAFLGENGANNWSAIRRRNGSRGFVYFAHDFEHSFFDINQDRTGPFGSENTDNLAYSNPMFIHHNLRPNAEYRMRWADRVQQHCFGSGVLTDESLHQRFSARAALIDKVIVAESARWGDAKTGEPLTRREWRSARDQLMEGYLPNRGRIVIRQLQEDGLYPTIDAPICDVPSGKVPRGSSVKVTASQGLIHYTWDGSDPREIGGSVNPRALSLAASTPRSNLLTLESPWRFLPVSSELGMDWLSDTFDDSTWDSGHGEMGFGDEDEDTVVPTISNPTPELSRNVTTYFRTTFSMPETTAPSSLSARVKFDDGLALYLNGEEVFRSENLPKGAGIFDVATSSVADENAVTTINIPVRFLRTGLNVVCAEIHQNSPESSDISFRCELESESSITSQIPIPDGQNTLKLRSLQNGEWSALTTVTLDAGNSSALLVNASGIALEAGKSGSISLNIQNGGSTSINSPIRIECEIPAGFRLETGAGPNWQVLSASATRLSAILIQPVPAGSTSTTLNLKGTVSTTAGESLQITTVLEVDGKRLAPASEPAPMPVTRTGPTTLALSSAGFIVSSDSTEAVISIIRTGDISGPSSVTLSTSDGTAMKASDYLPIAQTVNFAPGEYEKQVAISVFTPSDAERIENFKVTLSKPASARLGAPASALVVIAGQDNIPPIIQNTTKDTGLLTLPFATLTGTATDDQAVASIEVSVNGSPWQPFAPPQPFASKRATFAAPLELQPGMSTIALRAIDFAGNTSSPVVTTLNRLPSVPVITSSNPPQGGTITTKPAGLANWMPQGSPAEFRAVPAAGWFFSHWMMNPNPSEQRTNPLIVSPDQPTAITAVFKQSPYGPTRSGSFIGILQSADGNPASRSSEGTLKINVTNTGAFSGNLTLNNTSLPVAGSLGVSGEILTTDSSSEIVIPRKGESALKLQLKMDLHASPAVVTASVQTVERTHSRPLAQSILKRTTSSTPAQSFEIKLRPIDPQDRPRFSLPDSPLKISITKTASGSLVGKLPDGSMVSGSFPVCEDGSHPFVMAYGPTKQHILSSDTSLSAPQREARVLWIRNPDPNYIIPEGWPAGILMFWESSR